MVKLRILVREALARNQGALAVGALACNHPLEVEAEEEAQATVDLVAAHQLALHVRALRNLVAAVQEEAVPLVVHSHLVVTLETAQGGVPLVVRSHLVVPLETAQGAVPLVAHSLLRRSVTVRCRAEGAEGAEGEVVGLLTKPARAKSRVLLDSKGFDEVISVR